jgi:hypothetical protein
VPELCEECSELCESASKARLLCDRLSGSLQAFLDGLGPDCRKQDGICPLVCASGLQDQVVRVELQLVQAFRDSPKKPPVLALALLRLYRLLR